MQCEKCGHQNNPYSVICEKCGAPLNTENNEFLQEKYHHKGKHIDIEEIEKAAPVTDFNEMRRKVSRTVVAILILIMAFFLYFLGTYFVDRGARELLNTYNDYMKNSSLVVFYFGTNEELNQQLEEFQENYEFDYLQIESKNLSRNKKAKIREELNVYNLTSTVVVVQKGVPIATLSNVNDKESLITFLKGEGVIPDILEDTQKDLEAFNEAIHSDEPTLLYFPTKYSEQLESNSELLESIASQYSLQYYFSRGFIFSKNQLYRIMSQLGYSEIQDNLILYMQDGKIEKILLEKDKNNLSYFQFLSSYDIIDTSSADYLKNITMKQFKSFTVDEKNRYVILIRNESCVYCDRVEPVLGGIANQNQFTIYRLDATNTRDEISNLLNSMGLVEGLTSVPFLVVIERNHVIDYIAGPSSKELYIEKLTEVGVIR